jgi:hypothetical protein
MTLFKTNVRIILKQGGEKADAFLVIYSWDECSQPWAARWRWISSSGAHALDLQSGSPLIITKKEVSFSPTQRAEKGKLMSKSINHHSSIFFFSYSDEYTYFMHRMWILL